MNVKNLIKVFEHYIEKFEWLNQKPEPDESYKWLAVQKFQNAFDLEVPKDEFATMLYKTWKASANLIDSNQQQPFYALVEYARREPERVCAMFKNLYGFSVDQNSSHPGIYLLKSVGIFFTSYVGTPCFLDPISSPFIVYTSIKQFFQKVPKKRVHGK